MFSRFALRTCARSLASSGPRYTSTRAFSGYQELTTPNGIKYQQPVGLYIGGEFVRSKEGRTFETIDPSTENVIVQLEEAGAKDVDAAVDAAEKVRDEWADTDPYQRGRVLNKIADLIEAKHELISSVETWDNGKTLGMSEGDVANVIACFRYYAGWADKIDGELVETDKNHFNYTRREPIGVCGMVIPWNFPLLMLAWKIAPALACGNTLLLKTAESTPLSALLFADICSEVPELPKGAVNILSGYGPAGAAMSAHPRIKKIAFTGSTPTGRKILESSAKSNLKKVTLELGGKSPNIVFDDCDFDKTLDQVLQGIFFNQGEVCCAGSRVLLQESIYDKFLAALKERAEALVVGDPFDSASTYGPQTNKMQYERVMDYIEIGKKLGARILTGGTKKDGKGYFVSPTIFADVDNDSRIAREEIFGPVLVVIPFKDAKDAVRLANDSEYGLASGVHTQSLNRAIWTANHLKAGSVWVNGYNEIHHQMPFGGYGLSGIGRELGKEVLKNYTEVKSVRINDIQSGLN